MLSRRVVEKGSRELLLLLLTRLSYHYLMQPYKLCLFLISCCKSHLKMLVFDRPSFFPLTLVFLSCSPLYSLPFPFDTKMHKCLECLDVSLASMLDTRPLCFLPFCFLYTIAAIRCWSPEPGVVRRYPGRRPRLFDLCVICASLLKAKLD